MESDAMRGIETTIRLRLELRRQASQGRILGPSLKRFFLGRTKRVEVAVRYAAHNTVGRQVG